MLVSQLTYLSRATQYVDRAELQDITAASTARNHRAGISGALVFCDGFFLQILEGAPAEIEATFARIADDPRHADVQIIQRRDGVAREFADWGMSCLHESAMSQAQASHASAWVEILSRESVIDRIGNDAHLLLVELRDAIVAEMREAARRAA